MIGKTNKLPSNPVIWPARPHDFSGDNLLDIYNAETTQRYVAGTRFLRWDGSVFKYSRLKGTSVTGLLIWNTSGLINTAVTGATIAIGDRTMTFTLGADDGYGGGGYAEDELIGGINKDGYCWWKYVVLDCIIKWFFILFSVQAARPTRDPIEHWVAFVARRVAIWQINLKFTNVPSAAT